MTPRTEEAERITKQIYRRYGSSSGYLFGIRPDKRSSVKTIIRLVLEIVRYESERKKLES